ncbi:MULTISPECIES: NAD(P)/FAD-dependent oxidoreductase [Dyella]|uniref:FAD-dependent oxidoreductase n=2 Tax=Dyella TaxID=231454 RepID=A0A4R0YYZ1_9GAMM|nr:MULTISPECIES: FAD-dependent oxidoreductase [Dyella]TBR39792.1 FAD-dependent oxidoreductase [Dyella terrae]TCI12629.1 FAD-dependent oxidoreductase [Dyella soli]
MNFDVIVAGGGVIGASCAYHLSRRRDLRVALVDYKRPGNASRASAGGLWAIGESVGLGCGVIFFRKLRAGLHAASDQSRLVSADAPHILPKSFFDFALASNARYPALYRELKDEHGMDFKFERTGLKYVIYDDEDRRYAEHIHASIPHLSDEVCWLDQVALRTEEPFINPEAQGALEFLCDHQVNPFRLTDAYTEGARRQGATVLYHTDVVDVLKVGSRVTGIRTASGKTLSCNVLINAAGAWASDLSVMATGVPIPVKPVKGQIVLSERLPRVIRGCLSTSDCYIAQKDNGEVLIGSTTEDKGYDVSTTYPEIAGLVQGALRCLPGLSDLHVKRTWSGLRPGTPDELPILGRADGVDGYLHACGHFRTGILTSAITGEIIDALVHDEMPPVDIDAFAASRFA